MTISNMRHRAPLPDYVFSVPAAAGIPDVLRLKRYDRKQAEVELTPHRHGSDVLEILYLARGHQVFLVNGRQFAMRGGDILLIRPGETHSSGGKPQAKSLVYWTQFRVPAPGKGFLGLPKVESRALLAELLKPQLRLVPGTERMKTHLDTAIRILMRQGKAADMSSRRLDIPGREEEGWVTLAAPSVALIAARCCLTLFLVEVAAAANRHLEQATRPWQELVKSYLDSQMSEPLRTSVVAAHFGVSRPWFTTRFRQAFGVSPAQYFLQRKIELAREVIQRSPERSLTDIAFDFGFSSSQYFATVFRRYQGAAPGEVRRHASRHAMSVK